MKMTAMDIMNKDFKKTMRGYNMDEVDEFLEQISEDYETVYKENAILKEKLDVFQDKLEHYAKMETTIQSTLLLAQNAAEQAKQSSQSEAELILKNANESAKRILDKAHTDVLNINDEFDRTKQEFAKFRSKFRNFIVTQMEMFEALEKDFDKNYNISTVIEEKVQEPVLEVTSEKEVEGFEYNTAELEDIKSFFVDK
ncbi:DivIVA domain-containing protein [Clostridium sp.]|uniref:DivIVA domain-containing protein n=1 Tax=Clostridium sp. TaxID=1506 RepID=UPI003216C0E6